MVSNICEKENMPDKYKRGVKKLVELYQFFYKNDIDMDNLIEVIREQYEEKLKTQLGESINFNAYGISQDIYIRWDNLAKTKRRLTDDEINEIIKEIGILAEF